MTKPKKPDKGRLDYPRKEKVCPPPCNHGRSQHDKNGCTSCKCKTRHIDFTL